MAEDGTSPRLNESKSPTRATQQVWGRAKILSILHRTEEILCVPDDSSLVQGILDIMIEVCQAGAGTFFQVDDASDELVITQVRGDVESQYLVGLRLNRLQQDFPGISLREPKIYERSHLKANSVWLSAVEPTFAARIWSLINMPVAAENATHGVIQIFNFRRADLDLLSIISRRLALELKRRKEFNAAQRSTERLLTLMEMLGDVAGTLDRNQLLHLVTENAARLVDSERSSLFLVDPNTSEMVFQVAYQPPETERQTANGGNLGQHPTRTSEKPGSRKHPGAGARNNPTTQESEFSYFNRSAITVPLRSGPLESGQDDTRARVIGGLMVLNKTGASFQEEDAQLMRILANQASTVLQVAEIYESNEELFLGVIRSLVTAIDAKDPYTQGHSQRVSDYSVKIAQELDLGETLMNDIRIGSLLHDIGKIGIPDSILLKNGSLNIEENEIVREHPRTGVNILGQVKLMDPMLPAILEHHERLNGSGYPARLIDKQISWMGRIVAVADVFDAMTSNRPYRKSMSVQDVLSYLRSNAGILFDGRCIQALENIIARMIPE